MKKKEEKRTVTFEASKPWIQSYGGNLYFRRSFCRWLWVVVVLFVGGNVALMDRWSLSFWVGGAILGLALPAYFIFVFKLWRAGKSFWKEVKDLEQPIKLSTIPRWKWL